MAYNSALFNVSLAGPTLFGPVVNNAARIASQSLANGGKKYFVVLIITVRTRHEFSFELLVSPFFIIII